MNPSHRTRRDGSPTSRTTRAPLTALAAVLVTVAGCTDTPTKTDLTDLTVISDGFPVAQVKGGNGGGNGGGGGGGGGRGDDPGDFRPTMVTFADRAGDRISSDAALRTDLSNHDYVDGACGVWANIGNFNDARFDPDRDYKKGKHARTCGAARAVVFNFTDGRGELVAGTFFNIDGLDAMAVGATLSTTAQFNICNTLRFETVLATHPTATTWVVTTDGASDLATCSGSGTTNNMPFSLTITAQ